MFDYKHDKLPKIFNNVWLRKNQLHDYPTRNQQDFHIPTCNKNYLKSFPYFHFPKIWNLLPNHLKSITSRNLFKKKLYAHLLDLIEI